MFGIKPKSKQRRNLATGAEVPPSPGLPRHSSVQSTNTQHSWSTSSSDQSPGGMLDIYFQDSVSAGSSRSSRANSVSAASNEEPTNKYNGFTERQVEDLFEKMLTRRGIHESVTRSGMLSFTTDKKWLMVSQDMHAESMLPAPSVSSSSKRSTSDQREPDKSTPEFYIKQFLEPDMQGVTPRLVAHLAVSLRTMPLSWVRQFIEARGLQVITNVIGILNRRETKREEDLQMEAEILKCFKSLINNRWGAREAVSHPECIYQIVLSLVSPPIQTRKLVCEVLAFLCHVDLPKGQETVLKGMDKLKDYRREFGRFDAWFKLLDATLDGRGKMGSLVGASEDVRRLGGQGAPDSHLSDYALSNMMLVNSLISVVEDVEVRVHLRNQMNACGLQAITDKMLEFNSEHLRRHISIYKQMSDNDYEVVIEIQNDNILSDMNDPRDVFESLLGRVEGTRGYDFLLSALQHLLLINDQSDIQVRYYQLLDNLITQIVLDRKGLTADDFSGGFGWSVASLIDKFAEQDQLAVAIAEAQEAKEKYEKAIKEKQELELEINLQGDGLVGQLREKTNSLEDLLRMSRKTISTLQSKLKTLQQEYDKNLVIMDKQLREMYQTASIANTPYGQTEENRDGDGTQGTIYDRLRAQAILEDKEGSDYQDLPKAEGLSESFKMSLGDQLGSSAPSGFVIPGTLPLIGSTRRRGGGSFDINQYTYNDVAGESGAAVNNMSTAEILEGKYKQTNNEEASALKSRQPIKSMAADLEQRLRKKTEVEETTDDGTIPGGTAAGPSTKKDVSIPSVLEPEASVSVAGNKAKCETKEQSTIATTATTAAATAAAAAATTATAAITATTATIGTMTDGAAVTAEVQTPISSDVPPPPPPPPPAVSVVPSTSTSTASSKPISIASQIANKANERNSTTANDIPPTPPPPPMTGQTVPARSSSTISTADPSIPPPPPPPPPPGGSSIPPPPPPPPTSSSGSTAAAGQGAPPPPPPPPLPPAPGGPAPPPPPPPPAPGGPGAPPPPGAPMRKMLRYYPDVKTRALQWTKMQHQVVGKTVWGDDIVDEDALEDEMNELGVFNSIQELFAQRQVQRKRRVLETKKQEIFILDPKKINSINISILAKLKHVPFPIVIKKIYAVEDPIFTENLLKSLQENIPTPDELGKLSVFVKSASEEDLASLSRPDTFSYEVMKIERYKERIENMLFRKTFFEKHQQLSSNMSSVLEASTAVKDSTSFKELLKLILTLGNYMNGTTFQGGAFGIRIASINKLVDTKGTESTTTLLHFLVDTVEAKFPRIHGFLDDLRETGQACRVTLQDVVKEYNELRSGLQKLIGELEAHYGADYEAPEGDNFAEMMTDFRDKALSKFEELEVRYTSMDVAYKDAVSFYGENPSEMKPDEFFGIFKTFTSSWERAMSDNKMARKKLEQMERARRMESERRERIKTQRHRGVDTSEEPGAAGTDEDKNIMDNLLDRLRAGDLDTSNTKRRGERSAARERRLQRSESVAVMAEDLLRSIQTDHDSPPVPRIKKSIVQ